MDNQHRKIAGYRELSESEINLMNAIKNVGERVGEIVQGLKEVGDTVDQRWVEEGEMDLQKGIMSLVRSVAKPTTF